MNHYQSVEIHLDDIRPEDGHFLRDKSIGSLFTGWTVSGIKMRELNSGSFVELREPVVVMLRETAKRRKSRP